MLAVPSEHRPAEYVNRSSDHDLNPLRVEYVQECANPRQIEHSLGCEAVYNAPTNVIRFQASDATRPFVTRNVELLDLLAPQFEEQLKQYREEDSFLEAIAPPSTRSRKPCM